jgi:hypothetical protein
MFQGLPIQAFHGDIGLPVLFANFVNGADIRMVQRRGRSRFSPKSLQRLCVFSQFIGKKFQRNVTPEICVFRFVNDTHSPAAKAFDDFVMREGFANQRIGGQHVSHILGRAGRQVNEERSYKLAGHTINSQTGTVPDRSGNAMPPSITFSFLKSHILRYIANLTFW